MNFTGELHPRPANFAGELHRFPAAPDDRQQRLLRVLEERRVRRIGSNKEIELDIRFFFATNKDLEAGVERGTFREDLYSRIMAPMIPVPRLEDCREEIPALARDFVRSQLHPSTLTDSAVAYLKARRWPTNVRELQKLLLNAAMYADGGEIDAELLQGCDWDAARSSTMGGEERPEINLGRLACEIEPEGSLTKWETFELKVMRQASEFCGSGNKAAEVLRVAQSTYHQRIDRYSLKAAGAAKPELDTCQRSRKKG